MNDREAVPPFLKSKGEVKSIIPYTRKEMFLAYAAGEDVDKPTPITREEYFLCYLGDSSASIPDPITRTEKFIAKVYNDAVETPKPTTRLEYILAYITDGSRDTFDAFTPTTREEHFLLNAAEYIKQHSHITFTLSYYNDDGGVLLYSESVAEGGNGEYKGETPTKASTEQYDYSFVGWSSETGATEPTTDVLKNITADKNVYAAFEAVEKTFEVKFYNADVLLYTDENVEYGGTAAYSGNTPTKAETAQYTYTFIGWNSNSSASTADDNALTNVTADRNVYAIYTAAEKTFTVTFYNGEELIYTIQNVSYNGTATYGGDTPAKASTTQYTYTFSGWTKTQGGTTVDADALTSVTANRSVYAVFTQNERSYTVSYYSQDGQTLIDTESVVYGHNASFSGTTPKKASTSQYNYTFVGWNTSTGQTTATANVLDNITADKSVYAAFSETEKTFEVNFYNGDTLLETAQNVAYNGTATYTGSTPTKASTAQYTYTFAGWTKTQGSTTVDADALTGVTADRNVYAVFTATARSYTVTFMNVSTLMDTQTVTYGGTAVYGGTTPTKAETSEYTYTFAGWNTNSSASTADADALTNVTADRTVYAIFTAVSKGYTVYFYNGETLLKTVTGVPYGGTATYTGATPTSSQAGYIFSGWSPSNTNITADTSCYAQFVDEDMYESISDTWSEIIANVSNGTYSTKYHIGDTKKIDLGTEGEVIMQIVGIDADNLADNSGKAPITWISKQLLNTNHRMNPTKQSGTSGTGALGGWEACEMSSYLINTIKPLLPSEVRNALKTVKKYSKIYNTSGTAVNNVVSNDDIWIPSAHEVNFTGHETSGVTYSSAFPDNASRIKHKVGGSAAWWWLRSADVSTSFRVVNDGGSSSYHTAGNSGGVAVGFVI